MARTPRPQQPPEQDIIPSRIRLLRPYGFHEDGVHRFWRQDMVVVDPDEIALLTKRGAAYETLE